MRPSLLWLYVAIFAIGGASMSCGSCEKDEPTKEKRRTRETPESAPAAPKRIRAPKLDTSKLPNRASPTRVTEQEAKEVLPVPEGARALSDPTASAGGPQMKSTLCFDGSTVDQATAALKKSLLLDGWKNINHRASAGRHDRVSMSAQKAPYRLSARIMLGNWDGCTRTEQQVYASLTLHKLSDRHGASPSSAPDDTE